jgi:prepilin peptidase CpaA
MVWLAGLAGCLFAAAWWDMRAHRIPNGIVACGMAFGLGWHALAPAGTGLLPALAGLGLGLVLFLPLYRLRAMGAGDVKLMAMAGAFLGPADVLGAMLGTFVAGGVVGVGLVLWRRGLAGKVIGSLPPAEAEGSNGKPSPVGARLDPASRMPYAPAIALGTLGYLGWRYFPVM